MEHMSSLKMLYAHTSNSSERKNSSKASKKNILITRIVTWHCFYQTKCNVKQTNNKQDVPE